MPPKKVFASERKSRRCNFYDNTTGEPQRGQDGGYGCPRSSVACHYVHPDDPEWRTARDSQPLPAHHRYQSPSSPPRRKFGAARHSSISSSRQSPPQIARHSRSPSRRSRTPPRRKYSRSPPRHRSRSPAGRSPRGRRDSRSSRRYGSHSPHRDSHSHRFSSRDHSPRRDPLDKFFDRSNDASRASPSKQPSSSSVPTGPRALNARHNSTSSNMPNTPVPLHLQNAQARPLSSSSPASSLPHSQSDPAIPQSQPLVLPPMPQPLRAPPPIPVKEMSKEEKIAAWHERIRLSAEAVSERLEITKLDRDVQYRRNLIQAPRFETLSPDIKATLRAQLNEAETRSGERKRVLDGLIIRLVNADFWPIAPSHNLDNFESKIAEMKATLGSLYDGVSELQTSLKTVMNQDQRRQGGGEASGHDSARPLKRRRTTISESSPAPTTAAQPEDGEIMTEMQGSLENIQERLRSIDDHMAELRNDLIQHTQEVLDEFESRIDNKVDEIAAGLEPALLDGQLGPRSANSIADLEAKYSSADGDISALAEEIAELIAQLKGIKDENERLLAENTKVKETIAEQERKHKEQSEGLEETRRETRALSSAVATLLAAPKPQPVQPSLEVLLQTIEQPTLRTAREHVVPLLQEFRTNIEGLLSTHSTQLHDTVGSKLEQTAKTAQVLLSWIEQADPGGVSRIRRSSSVASVVSG